MPNNILMGQLAMANQSTYVHENQSNIFWDILATDKQTEKQTEVKT